MTRIKNDAYLLSSLNNSLKILDLLMVRDDLRMSEIAKILELDRTSVFKMLYTLEHRGYIYKDAHAHYHLGNKLAGIQQLSAYRKNIVDVAIPAIYRIWARYQKTVMLGVMGTDDRILVAAVKTEKDQDSIMARVGASMDIYTTATGKILLSNLDPKLQKALIERVELKKHTEYTITDPDKMIDLLTECAQKKWVVSYEENHLNHCDIAVPVYDYSGSCVAALCIITDRKNMDGMLPAYRAELLEAARQISEQLGYSSF